MPPPRTSSTPSTVSAGRVSELMVEGLGWDDFTDRFRDLWEPGDHMALCGPTKSGKTTFAAQLLPTRRYVLALDAKGGDSNLAKLEQRGFERIGSWPPPPRIRRAIRNGEPARLIVGRKVDKRTELAGVRDTLRRALEGAWDDGGWTIYFDEFQVTADRRMMALTTLIEENFIAARDRGITMVTSFQRPANVPRAASDQASWLAVYRNRDVDVQARLAEMMGRPRAELRGAMRGLERHWVLIAGRDAYQPLLMTKPPAL